MIKKTFFEDIKELLLDIPLLLVDLIRSALLFNISIFKDLCSYRNKLVFATFIMAMYISVKHPDYRVALSAMALWNIILAYYFKKRQESAQLEAELSVERCSVCDQSITECSCPEQI